VPPSSPSGARWHEPAKQSRFVDSCFQTWTLHGRTSVTDRADPQAGSASLLPGQISKRRAFPYDPVSLDLPFATTRRIHKPGRLHFCPGRFQKEGRSRTTLCRWACPFRRHGRPASRVGFTSAQADFKKTGVSVRPCVAGPTVREDTADPQAGSASLLPGQISKRRAFPYDPVWLGPALSDDTAGLPAGSASLLPRQKSKRRGISAEMVGRQGRSGTRASPIP